MVLGLYGYLVNHAEMTRKQPIKAPNSGPASLLSSPARAGNWRALSLTSVHSYSGDTQKNARMASFKERIPSEQLAFLPPSLGAGRSGVWWLLRVQLWGGDEAIHSIGREALGLNCLHKWHTRCLVSESRRWETPKVV